MLITNSDKQADYTISNIVMLKPVKVPSEEEFHVWLDEAQEWANSVGYTEDDVADIIKGIRNNKEC